MDYRELLKQYLDGLGSKEINAVAGLYLVGFADWLQNHHAAAQSVQRTGCPVPHPQADFEFICDLCGKHIPARRR